MESDSDIRTSDSTKYSRKKNWNNLGQQDAHYCEYNVENMQKIDSLTLGEAIRQQNKVMM